VRCVASLLCASLAEPAGKRGQVWGDGRSEKRLPSGGGYTLAADTQTKVAWDADLANQQPQIFDPNIAVSARPGGLGLLGACLYLSGLWKLGSDRVIDGLHQLGQKRVGLVQRLAVEFVEGVVDPVRVRDSI
jgi:hypothetical protein